jgi:hypothetical protein
VTSHSFSIRQSGRRRDEGDGMKLWLDDERDPAAWLPSMRWFRDRDPAELDEWTWVKTAPETIALLNAHNVTEVSLMTSVMRVPLDRLRRLGVDRRVRRTRLFVRASVGPRTYLKPGRARPDGRRRQEHREPRQPKSRSHIACALRGAQAMGPVSRVYVVDHGSSRRL